MIQDFNKAIVLTSQNPEGFLNFRSEIGDTDASLYFRIISPIEGNRLYVNGIDANLYSEPSEGYALILAGDVSTATFHLFSSDLYDFELSAAIDVSAIASFQTFDISILNRPFIIGLGEISNFPVGNSQVENETSYLILRTNPKFSGNIKIVADESSNLYLDTFKVTEVLNNKKYRKQKISSNSTYSGDIRRTFSSLPQGNLHEIDKNILNVSLPKTTLNDQYNLSYSYGARLFLDDLYSEDYSLLAPIWINNKLPDYFAVFRLDGVCNFETYDASIGASDFAYKFIKDSDIIKTWGMKINTPIGDYLRNHLNEFSNVVRSPIFLSLSDPNSKDPDPNIWGGVSVKSGITTKVSETTYAFDLQDSFTSMNAYISTRFENNNILLPNLLNMEFVFSDNDVSLYTMSRYFGLYLTENEIYRVSYYRSNPDSSISILSLDGKDVTDFINSSIFDSLSGDISTNFSNRLFTLNDTQKIKRIRNYNEINGQSEEYISEWLNQPGELLFSAEVSESESNKFLTFSLNSALAQGEHLRIIDSDNNKIWEVVSSSTDLLEAGESLTYCTEYIKDGFPAVYRTIFSSKGDRLDQIRAIRNALNVFESYSGTPFRIASIDENSYQISIEILDGFNNYKYSFQRITSQTLNNPIDPSSGFDQSACYCDLKYFGVFNPEESDFNTIQIDSSFGPINYEIFGERLSMIIDFIDPQSNYLYSISPDFKDFFIEYMMYMTTGKDYKLILPFDVSSGISHPFNFVSDPHSDSGKLIIQTAEQIYRVLNRWNAYRTYPLIISLMGINPVKDFDFTVYDASLNFGSPYFYSREDDIDTYNGTVIAGSSSEISQRGSFEIISGSGTISVGAESLSFNVSDPSVFAFNTFYGAVTINAGSDVTYTYNKIDGSHNYLSYDSSISEENLLDYYKSNGVLKYGLTVPTVTKWSGLGQDCRNNPLRLYLDASAYDSSSNFIPFGDNFSDEISFPVFKYLDTGTKAWESYIYYDINDVVQTEIDSSIVHKTVKELMLENPYLDIFSKLVYSNKGSGSPISRSSICYYNDFKSSLEVIIGGMNLSFILNDTAKNLFTIKDWNKFKVSFISTPSKNTSVNLPMEVFVNENTATILIIWYQGSDCLNFNKRYSTKFGGKSLLGPENTYQWASGYANDNSYWSFAKTPFLVNTASLSSDLVNMYGRSTTYDSSLCTPFAQFNKNFEDNIQSAFIAFNYNLINLNSFYFFEKQYNSFDEFINYQYIKNSASFGSSIVNFGYTYSTNSNFYIDNTTNLEQLKWVIYNNYINYTIFRGETIYDNNSFASPPITLIINDPKNYNGLYTYHGWYKPSFNDILKFTSNEVSDISDSLNKDFILGNTNLVSHNKIPQFWYNKVVDAISDYDIAINNGISFTSEFDVFSSQWDSQYYTKFDGSLGFGVNGYNASMELPSFFGSKLIKLPDSLILDSWDTNTAKYYEEDNKYILEFNLTRKILSMFKENQTFISNWEGLVINDNIVNNYISDTIIGYYNINKGFISAEIWNKEFDGNILAYDGDSGFIRDEASNFTSNLFFQNGEHIYRIWIPQYPELTYLIKFGLFEK